VQVRELARLSVDSRDEKHRVFPVMGQKRGQALEGLPRMNLLGTFSATRRL
jgi:hypothetical protein